MRQAIEQLMRRKVTCFTKEEGVTLVEALIALAIVSIIFVALLAALSTSALTASRADTRITAESLARSQIEYTKAQVYRIAPASYEILTPLPPGYVITAQAEPIAGRDSAIQKLTVTVSHQGKTVVILEDLRSNR